MNVTEFSQAAKTAAKIFATLPTEVKNTLLKDMAKALRNNQSKLLDINQQEVERAHQQQVSEAMIDRLILNQTRIEDMATGLEEVAELPDPVGQLSAPITRPNGIQVHKMSIPLGVICMIYESRPNVTADASALCLKSGNAVILRGGKEAIDTSLAIADILHSVLVEHGLPKEVISVVPEPEREIMLELLQQSEHIDLVIPRGGEGLIRFVSEHSRIPVIQHYKGVCHLYVDEESDQDKALELLINGKTHRYGVCNALECALIDSAIADEFLPKLKAAMDEKAVLLHGCAQTNSIINCADTLNEQEFGVEYLGPELAVRVVSGLDGAIEHIATFGSQHTEVICTTNETKSDRFLREVDASVVMVNASSRFSDGSQLGLGAEIGIATTKLHAYGPMGLESLTAEKFVVKGSGQIRN